MVESSSINTQMQAALEHHHAGRLEQARAAYERILAVDPRNAEAMHGLGIIAGQNGKYDAAAELIQRAISVSPGEAHYYSNLAMALEKQGKLEDVLECRRSAAARFPADFAAHFQMGNAAWAARRPEEARASYERALALKPDLAEAHNNLGTLRWEARDLDGAIGCYSRALQLRPRYPDALNNLGNTFKEAGRLTEAIDCFEAALAIDPTLVAAHDRLVYTWHYHPDSTPEKLLEENLRWGRQHARPLENLILPHANERSPERRLRIGFISPDFCTHPVGRFIAPLLERHNPEACEFFCYSHVSSEDAMTARLKAGAEHWRDITRDSDAQAAQRIREDQIDILVDLAMHSGNNRLLIFAQKPAPVQVTYLAYASTTGLRAIDYRLTDPFLDPPGQNDAFYSEESIHLQHYWCYEPNPAAPAIVSPPPLLAAGHVTFGCLNNFSKINARCLRCWCNILCGVPRSRLILHTHEGSHRRQLLERAAAEGVDAGRITFTGRMNPTEYFEMFQKIDIALDPFPYCGATTTCDALWMGVPVISLVGRTGVSRAGLSILSAAGLPDLACGSEDDYAKATITLAGDAQSLATLRAGLRERLLQSPLMNSVRFARDMENVFRTIWRTWCGGNARAVRG